MNVGTPLISNTQASELVQPGERALHHPAQFTESAILVGAAPRQQRLDALDVQHHLAHVRVVRLVGDDGIRTPTRRADLAAHRGNRVDQLQQLRAVVDVRRRDRCDQRNAARLRNDMVFRAGFSAVSGVRAGMFAPPQRGVMPSRRRRATSR
jgi:hypothetical protein